MLLIKLTRHKDEQLNVGRVGVMRILIGLVQVEQKVAPHHLDDENENAMKISNQVARMTNNELTALMHKSPMLEIASSETGKRQANYKNEVKQQRKHTTHNSPLKYPL